MELLQDFYETTLDALKDAKNDRLWFKTNSKLGKLYFDRGDYNKLSRILKQLHQSCQVIIFFSHFHNVLKILSLMSIIYVKLLYLFLDSLSCIYSSTHNFLSKFKIIV